VANGCLGRYLEWRKDVALRAAGLSGAVRRLGERLRREVHRNREVHGIGSGRGRAATPGLHRCFFGRPGLLLAGSGLAGGWAAAWRGG